MHGVWHGINDFIRSAAETRDAVESAFLVQRTHTIYNVKGGQVKLSHSLVSGLCRYFRSVLKCIPAATMHRKLLNWITVCPQNKLTIWNLITYRKLLKWITVRPQNELHFLETNHRTPCHAVEMYMSAIIAIPYALSTLYIHRAIVKSNKVFSWYYSVAQ